MSKKSALPEETRRLLYSYFEAFSNLYGIIPLYKALSIIQKQNPELGLTEAEFLEFADSLENEDHFYAVVGAEDLYEGVTEKTPPLRRELVSEYLYYGDDTLETYEELEELQKGKPFYIPEKEELLRYEDDFYYEKTPQYQKLRDFLKNKMKFSRADDILDDLCGDALLSLRTSPYAVEIVQRLAGENCFKTTEQLNEFLRLYTDMYNHTRIHANRGFQPAELAHPSSEEPFPSGFDFSLPEPPAPQPRPKKPGRNDPCPCGSGKKYKKCCGR